MILHLTRDEWDQIAAEGGGVLFRESELPYGDPCPCGRGEHPPAEFVEAAQPCETCGGEGYASNEMVMGVTCPDCLDGKRRIAVAVPCEWDGQGVTDKKPGGTYHAVDDEIWLCDCNDGLVTVGHVVVEWGPLVVTDGEFLGLGRQVWEMTPDPLPTPGQYAIGVKVVEP